MGQVYVRVVDGLAKPLAARRAFGYVTDLPVLSEHRNHAVEMALVDAVKQHCEQARRGVDRLLAWPSGHTGGWEKLGFHAASGPVALPLDQVAASSVGERVVPR